jgi:hypothetical protein
MLLRDDWIPRVLTSSMDKFIDDFINEWSFRSYGLVRGRRLLEACLLRVYAVVHPSFFSLCFPATMR